MASHAPRPLIDPFDPGQARLGSTLLVDLHSVAARVIRPHKPPAASLLSSAARPMIGQRACLEEVADLDRRADALAAAPAPAGGRT